MKHSLKEVKLANGIKGLFIDVPGATVMTYDINFRAGEYLVSKAKWETPHLMEHVLLGANQLIPKARAFQAEFEKNGAYCNASTSSYDINYEAECADFEWERILDLLLTAVTKPLFLEDEFIAEYGNVKEELNARSNNHFRHLSLALRKAYGFKALTDQERVELMSNVELTDIRSHYEVTHTTDNLRFIIAGQLPIARRRQIAEIFSSIELPNGHGRLELPIEKPKKLKRPLYIANPTVKNIYFFIDTFLNRRMSDPEYDALTLMNTMLTETLYSRILGTARERGLVYSMSSGIGQTKNASNWWFGAQVTPKNAPQLFEIIVNELQAVFNGNILEADIAAAKQYALGRYQRSAQTVAGTANGYAWRYYYDGKIDDYYQIPDRIEAISKDIIVKTAQSMFKENVWGIGVLGGQQTKIANQLEKQISVLWQN